MDFYLRYEHDADNGVLLAIPIILGGMFCSVM